MTCLMEFEPGARDVIVHWPNHAAQTAFYTRKTHGEAPGVSR